MPKTGPVFHTKTIRLNRQAIEARRAAEFRLVPRFRFRRGEMVPGRHPAVGFLQSVVTYFDKDKKQ